MVTRPSDAQGITNLLHQWQAGEPSAQEQLLDIVHGELRRLARVHMRGERPDHVLQPTALVNEVYLRLAQLHSIQWRDRTHFFAMASRLMRRILVDAARERGAGRRGRGFVRVTLNEARAVNAPAADLPDVLALDQVLTKLAALDERKAHLVELRFFGGLTMEESAETLDVSVETAARDWRTAKLWLRRELGRAV